MVVTCPRAFIAVPGVWTDAWFDAPDAWRAWVCAWAGWSLDDWRRFRTAWGRADHAERAALSQATGVHFLDWRRVKRGSILGKVSDAVALLVDQLNEMPDHVDVTLVGHSKGGNVIKSLLARGGPDAKGSPLVGHSRGVAGGRVVRAAIVSAPIDPLREIACAVVGLGIRPIGWHGVPDGVRVATVNNWYDPSGGRLRGVPNYQVRLWNDNFLPWPPHGLKSSLAQHVLADLGALQGPLPLPHLAGVGE